MYIYYGIQEEGLIGAEAYYEAHQVGFTGLKSEPQVLKV